MCKFYVNKCAVNEAKNYAKFSGRTRKSVVHTLKHNLSELLLSQCNITIVVFSFDVLFN